MTEICDIQPKIQESMDDFGKRLASIFTIMALYMPKRFVKKALHRMRKPVLSLHCMFEATTFEELEMRNAAVEYEVSILLIWLRSRIGLGAQCRGALDALYKSQKP